MSHGSEHSAGVGRFGRLSPTGPLRIQPARTPPGTGDRRAGLGGTGTRPLPRRRAGQRWLRRLALERSVSETGRRTDGRRGRASHAFFSTCGSSLSVRAAMMAVAGGSDGGLLVPRDSHKSIVGGLIFSGIQPRWIPPRWDDDRHLSHPPSPERVSRAWDEHPDAAGALIVSPSPYGNCADLKRISGDLPRPGQAGDRRRGLGRSPPIPP